MCGAPFCASTGARSPRPCTVVDSQSSLWSPLHLARAQVSPAHGSAISFAPRVPYAASSPWPLGAVLLVCAQRDESFKWPLRAYAQLQQHDTTAPSLACPRTGMLRAAGVHAGPCSSGRPVCSIHDHAPACCPRAHSAVPTTSPCPQRSDVCARLARPDSTLESAAS
jgi:hypothetical protein